MFQFGSCTRVDTVSIIRGDAFRNILFMPVQFFFFSVSKITGNIGGVGGGGFDYYNHTEVATSMFVL